MTEPSRPREDTPSSSDDVARIIANRPLRAWIGDMTPGQLRTSIGAAAACLAAVFFVGKLFGSAQLSADQLSLRDEHSQIVGVIENAGLDKDNLSAGLVQLRSGRGSLDLSSSPYLVKESMIVLDLRSRTSGATDENPSEVVRYQSDLVQKLGNHREPFAAFHGTNGLGMSVRSTSHPRAYSFEELERSSSLPYAGSMKYNYELKIPLHGLAAGQETTVTSRAVYKNAFQGETDEWAAVKVRYPTERVNIVVIFPSGKPCKKLDAKRSRGDVTTPDNTTTSLGRQDCKIVQVSYPNVEAGEKASLHFTW